MRVSSPEISRALLNELKALRSKHLDFQARVKAADTASRARDKEAQEQNHVLTQRIVGLEDELKRANESIEALREFVELLPTFRNEIDSFENDVEAFEARGFDTSGLKHATSASARVDVLENGIGDIIELDSPSISDTSDLIKETDSNFSVVEGSVERPRDTPPALKHNSKTVDHPETDAQHAYTHTGPLILTHSPSTVSKSPTTNRERLELVTKLMEQPMKNGDVWFIIPQPWFNDWKNICQLRPDDETQIEPVNTSLLVSHSGEPVSGVRHGSVHAEIHDGYSVHTHSVPSSIWHHLLSWYGSDSVYFPRLVMPSGSGGLPSMDRTVVNVYFLLPPGGFNAQLGGYTPKVIFSPQCLVRTLRSIIINGLPQFPAGHSIDFFFAQGETPPNGWYRSHLPAGQYQFSPYIRRTIPALLECQSSQIVNIRSGDSIVVSVKVLDESKGCMVPIDPFQASDPPKIFTWSPSCP